TRPGNGRKGCRIGDGHGGSVQVRGKRIHCRHEPIPPEAPDASDDVCESCRPYVDRTMPMPSSLDLKYVKCRIETLPAHLYRYSRSEHDRPGHETCTDPGVFGEISVP